ncbi:Integrase catalytic core protein, partial [Globisporangium splendens]
MASLSAKIELSAKGIPVNWDGKNWEYYKAMMRAIFGENELLEIATGTLKEDQNWDDARKAKFKTQQAKIFRLIMSSLNMNLANKFLNHQCGSDIWADFVKTYEGHADPLRKSFEIRRLVQQLQNYECKHGDMETHITAMFRIRDRLALLQHAVQSEDMIAALLKAMPKSQEYRELKRSIRIGASAQNYTPEGVRDMILLAEAEMLEEDTCERKIAMSLRDDGSLRKRSKHQKQKKSQPSSAKQAAAGGEQKHRINMKTAGAAAKKRAGTCVSTRDRKKLQRQTQKRVNDNDGDRPKQVNADLVDPDSGEAETEVLACYDERGIDVDRANPEEDEANLEAGTTDIIEEMSDNAAQSPCEWHFDTGCNIHIVGCKDYFTTYRDFREEEKCEGSLTGFVRQANVTAKGTGRILLTTRCGSKNGAGKDTVFFLDDVMFVPHAASNLLSPGLAIRQGFELEFDKSRNALQLWKNGELCVEAEHDEENDIWPFTAYNNFLNTNVEIPQKSRVVGYTRADGVADLRTWHTRLGHTCPQYLKIMVDRGMVEGMQLKKRDNIFCDACQLAKQRRKTHAREIAHDTKHPNEVVYADLLSPGHHSKGNVSQMLVIMDGYSRFLSIYLLKCKADTNARMMDYVKLVERQAEPFKVKLVVTDKGTEFENKEIKHWYASQGIAHLIVGPRAQQQNPVERANQSILKMIKVQLKHSGLPPVLWTDAATNAVYIKNRVYTKGTNGVTPWEKFHTKRPDLHHIRTFGAIAYAHVPRSERSNKLDDNCVVGYLLGYEEGVIGCKIYCPESRTRRFVSDVQVNENILYKDRHKSEAQSEFERWFQPDTPIDEEGNLEIESNEESDIDQDVESTVSNDSMYANKNEGRASSERFSKLKIDNIRSEDTAEDHDEPMCVIGGSDRAEDDADKVTIEFTTEDVDAEPANVGDDSEGNEIASEIRVGNEIASYNQHENVGQETCLNMSESEHDSDSDGVGSENSDSDGEPSEWQFLAADANANHSLIERTEYDEAESVQEINDELHSRDNEYVMESLQNECNYESKPVVYNDGDDGDDPWSDDKDICGEFEEQSSMKIELPEVGEHASSSGADVTQGHKRLDAEVRGCEPILPETSTTLSIDTRMHTDQHGLMPTQMIGSRRKLPVEYEEDEHTRPKRNVKLPKKYDDFLIYSALNRKEKYTDRLRPQDIRVPRNYREAMRSLQMIEWKRAMDEEMNALRAKQVLEPIDRIPEEKHAISSRWVLSVKTDNEGYIEKYKARLVARGFKQIMGVDFHETFSPVARISSFRLLLALATHLNLKLWQADINTAYLNAELHEVQYLQGIEGFPGPNAYVVRKALYGLRQSGREWNSEINKWFVENKFKRCRTEPCLYVFDMDGILALVLVYVDDLICATNYEAFKTDLFKKLDNKYGIKDLGKLHQYLAIQVEQNEKSITIHQEQYAKTILERFGFDSGSNSTRIPMEATAKYTSNTKPKEESEREKFAYREAIGALMYLVTCTRPDMTYAVGQLSRFVENPSEQHVGGVKKILRYLIGTKRKGITYHRGETIDLGIHVHGFADSDWAGDLETRKSTTGFVFTLSGGAVSWTSRRQTITAQSTAEAEYVAACEACMEGKTLLNLLREIKPDEESELIIGVDNHSSYIMATDPTFSRKTRHIEMKWHYVREQVENGHVRLWKVKSAENPADLFTKPLPKDKLIKLTAIIGMNTPETD